MYKQTLIEATQAGAAQIKKFFNGTFTISHKEGVNNLVTQADFAADQAIREVIKKNFPEHGIVSEEDVEVISESDYKWIIDPIDGTINFANGIPICCVSIGLEYQNEMLMGAVFNPIMNEFYFAEKGKGATLNDQKISVSDKPDLLTSCMVTGFPYNYLDEENSPLVVFEKFVRKGIPVRRLGSAAIDLCWVAAGRFDAFYEHQLHAWDSAAGFIIVEEAGGKVTNLKGEKYSPYKFGIVASNGLIHDDLVKVVNGGEI
ncbi:MAG: inositol monophosphatase family protein [Ginsengibacter sp.]